jgi:hypothetical protein
MSGPIVRTGTTPEFWANWDSVFGDKSKSKAGKKTGAAKKKAARKSPKKSGKAVATKKKATKSSKRK